MASSGQVHRGGRPYKGPRTQLATRVPVHVGDGAKAEAERLGLSLNDFLANLIAERLGYPPVTALNDQGQDQLIA